MKRKDLEKFKNKSVAQLSREISDLREKAWDSKQLIFKGKGKNVRKASAMRRDIAQLSTLIQQRAKQEANELTNGGKAGKPANGGKVAVKGRVKKAGKLANKVESK